MKKFLLSALICGFCLASFSSNEPLPIEIKDAFIKESMPNAKATGGFMTIQNNTNKAIKLTGASSDLSEFCEIHIHKNVDGMMKMVKVDEIEIPARSDVVLKPGGLHIMFINLKEEAKENDVFDLNLTFDGNQTMQLGGVLVKKVEMKKH